MIKQRSKSYSLFVQLIGGICKADLNSFIFSELGSRLLDDRDDLRSALNVAPLAENSKTSKSDACSHQLKFLTFRETEMSQFQIYSIHIA